ncbi:DUF3303 family protein [Actinocatenispora rupis]|uniref:Uncharacterized protein n=1 Tax=Actinocatenispora rupis TaxID=519421 RepID=A0A8J3JA62_9ACTN|nr:DUF3303 family protein [Actinocatenispora rupis]GID12909.1 hypothetical protein Aru02nite_37980 [Actinocatenispora rupis]
MRMMARFEIDTEAGNELIRTGEMLKGLDQMLEMLKPEAAYFFPSEGSRGGVLVFDLDDPAQIVSVVEPMWVAMRARVELTPVMNAEELRAGVSAFQPR